jgi:hypothetical protein
MSRPISSRRLSGGLLALGALLLPVALAPASALTGAPAAKALLPGLTYAAGRTPTHEHEPEGVLPDAAIADLDAAGNQHKYQTQAAALPQAQGNLKWSNVGPLGQDDPADYPTGGLRFSRSAGMGAAVEVDPRDPSGNSVYVGNMGGLWYSKDAGSHWTSLSDASFSRGAVGAIGVDPGRPTDLYAGTGIGYITTSGDAPGSGVFVSHDAGKTWSRPAKNIRGYASNDIEVTPNGVLLGSSNGLYVSTDRGGSFTRVSLPNNATHTGPATGSYANWISSVVSNPLNPNEITVAVGLSQGKKPGPDGQPLSPGNGLYRSTTGPKGPYTYLASTSLLRHPAASVDPIGRIMLSYAKAPGGDATVLWAILSDAGLAYGKQPAEADLVSATTGHGLNATNTQLNGLYRSDDDGATWNVKATPQSLSATVNEGLGIYPALGYGVGVQASYNLWVAADPRDPDDVYFGLEEVFQSTAGTQSGPGLGEFEIIQRYWDVCGSTTYLENIYKGQTCPDQTPYYGGVSTHPDQHAGRPVVTPKGLRLYTANDGGFFRQDSHAIATGRNAFDNDQWVEMNTLASVQAWKIARKPDGEYLTALQDNGGGFFKRNSTATLVSSGDGVNAVATSDPDTWYLSAQGAIVYVTTDHGKTIRAIPADLANPSFLSPLAIDPTDDNHLVVAGRDIHETTKGPNTTSLIDPLLYTVISTDWTQSFDAGDSPTVNNGVTVAWGSQALAVRGAAVYSAICGLCRNAVGDPELVRSTVATNVKPGCVAKKASSDCWHVAAGKGLPHNSIWNLAIDPTNSNIIYVALNNNSLVGFDPKVGGTQRVMVSKNAGESFTDITGNLPQSQARDVVVRGNQLIVATDNGVFTAGKGGLAWSRLGAGLPPVRVFDLSLDPTGRYLTGSVYGRGVWELDFNAKSPSSSGPGPQGEPPTSGGSGGGSSGGGGLPATGPRGGIAALALMLLVAGVAVRRLGRRAAARSLSR